MNRLDKHIEILLLGNDCVIVPGLGGFMAHHVPSRYDVNDNMFVPPTRTLGFNPQLVMNDSLLAQAYVESYDISYPEAVRRIEEEVNEVRQVLELEEEYYLSGIGRLFYNIEGKIEFEPCDAGILTPWLYGLSCFEMRPLGASADKQETSVEKISVSKEVQNHTLNDNTVTDTKNEEPDTVLNDDDNNDLQKTICIPINALRYAVAAACMIIAVALFPTQQGDHLTEQSSICSQQITIETMPKAKPLAASVKKANKQQTTVKKNAEAIESSQPEATITEAVNPDYGDTKKNTDKYYTIILASKVTQSNAEAFVKLLDTNGIKASVFTHNKTTRVISGRYNKEEDAYNALRQMREAHEDAAEAWVMEINN